MKEYIICRCLTTGDSHRLILLNLSRLGLWTFLRSYGRIGEELVLATIVMWAFLDQVLEGIGRAKYSTIPTSFKNNTSRPYGVHSTDRNKYG